MQSADLTPDFFCLYLQVAILVAIIARELIRPRQRNLYAVLISAGLLVLVCGQAWWMLTEFEQSGVHEIEHLLQTISLEGARLANLYAGLGVACFGLVYWAQTRRKPIDKHRRTSRRRLRKPTLVSYLLIGGWVALMTSGLLMSAGGVVEAITAPGLNLAYGATMFLILISVGKFPLLQKVAIGRAVRPIDVGLFSIVFLLTLFNSRMLASLMLLQVILIANYCRREISRRMLIVVPIAMFAIFIMFGLYREFAALSGGAIDQDALFDFLAQHANWSALLRWFYGANVEGFAGLAGILTYDANVGGISHDFGLSNLGFLFQFLPGALRNDPGLPIRSIVQDLASVYPYSGSIVRPGFEIAFAGFGLPGIIVFCGLLAYLANSLHRRMIDEQAHRLRVAIVSVQSLQLIRGTFANAVFFGLSDLIMLTFYWFLLMVSRGLLPDRVRLQDG